MYGARQQRVDGYFVKKGNGGRRTYGLAEETIGLVFVLFALGRAELSAHVDAFFKDAADEGFGCVPGPVLYLSRKAISVRFWI